MPQPGHHRSRRVVGCSCSMIDDSDVAPVIMIENLHLKMERLVYPSGLESINTDHDHNSGPARPARRAGPYPHRIVSLAERAPAGPAEPAPHSRAECLPSPQRSQQPSFPAASALGRFRARPWPGPVPPRRTLPSPPPSRGAPSLVRCGGADGGVVGRVGPSWEGPHRPHQGPAPGARPAPGAPGPGCIAAAPTNNNNKP